MKSILLVGIILVSFSMGLRSQEFQLPSGEPFTPDPYANETEAERDARMEWWRDARFGMFIHWGLYAVPAGTYDGERIPGIGEWIMLKGEIPVEEYRAYAEEFNPTEYDPGFWAQLAKEAGMRYMVITSKHHDGFALFPSAVTDWDVEDATPYGEDLIGPLAEAARDEGLKFGLYYSQCQDWIHPGGSKSGYRRQGTHWDDAQIGDYNEYLEDIAIPQVGEILARYQPDILWWDTPMGTRPEHAARLIPLLRIKPGIIHNNRLGGGFEGDTDTPEQHIPATGIEGRDWEVCMTMNDTWGYKSYDDNWKSSEELIQKLCDIVSKGGNFLLNVGPNAKGEIPEPSIERLRDVGAWMDVNGESIYGTSANPFHRLPWGRATKKVGDEGTVLYLQVFDWPEDGELVVPGLLNTSRSIRLLATGESLESRSEGDSLVIEIPSEAPDPYVSVIKMEVDGDLEIASTMPMQARDGGLVLTPVFVDIHNRGYGDKAFVEDGRIRNWVEDGAWISWTFRIDRPGDYAVQAEVAGDAEAKLRVGLKDGEMEETVIEASGDSGQLELRNLGQVTFPDAGVYQLEFRPVREEWNPIEVGTVVLRPVE